MGMVIGYDHGFMTYSTPKPKKKKLKLYIYIYFYIFFLASYIKSNFTKVIDLLHHRFWTRELIVKNTLLICHYWWVSVSSTSKVFYGWIRDLEFSLCLHKKSTGSTSKFLIFE